MTYACVDPTRKKQCDVIIPAPRARGYSAFHIRQAFSLDPGASSACPVLHVSLVLFAVKGTPSLHGKIPPSTTFANATSKASELPYLGQSRTRTEAFAI
jgi:hypothetical protein